MTPANQRFCADHNAGPHVDLRLVIQDKLSGREGASDMFEAFMVAANIPILFGIEEMETIFSGELGLIHGLVRLAQQLIGIDVFRLRVERNAEAG